MPRCVLIYFTFSCSFYIRSPHIHNGNLTQKCFYKQKQKKNGKIIIYTNESMHL